MDSIDDDLLVSSYDYSLSPQSIAQYAIEPRDHAKLLLWRDGVISHHRVCDLPDILDDRFVMIFNDSKVLKARITLCDVRCVYEGKERIVSSAEIFFLRHLDTYDFEALVRPGKKFPVGMRLFLSDEVYFDVLGVNEMGRIIHCSSPLTNVFEKFGQLPLPPYIDFDESKTSRYQTIFAQKEGSVAAPTASLHFTHDLLGILEKQGTNHEFVTLHVGLGTFKPLEHEDVKSNHLHQEYVEIDRKLFIRIASYSLGGKKLLPVGTTCLRVLESLPYVWKIMKENCHFDEFCCDFSDDIVMFWNTICTDCDCDTFIYDVSYSHGSVCFHTCLFIYPGYKLRLVHNIFTNFHLPKSSLLMLVASVLGSRKGLFSLYKLALRDGYRFYSFGDAMMVLYS